MLAKHSFQYVKIKVSYTLKATFCYVLWDSLLGNRGVT